MEPLIRALHASVGLGNVVELRVTARRTGRQRAVLLGLLRARSRLYLGHPNGETAWTRDLEAADRGQLAWRHVPALWFRPIRLGHGQERDAAIRATDQHPFPGNLIYRLARRHVLAVGVYFRLEPLEPIDPVEPIQPLAGTPT
jgi:hypothetical protein